MKQFPSDNFRILALLILTLAFISACEKRADSISEMGVSFQWNPAGTALDLNPEIRLSNVPPATHSFSVELVDLDMKIYDHGSGVYAFDGSPVIPAGGLDGDYQGPHPPPGVIHRYEITVKALDAAGTVIGEGCGIRQYPEPK